MAAPYSMGAVKRFKEALEQKRVEPIPRIIEPCLMLCGLALEVLLKAKIVSLGKTKEKSGTIRGTPLDSHDLVELATIAEYALDEEEQQFLRMASTYVFWFGRYPIPSNQSQMIKEAVAPPFTLYDRLFKRWFEDVDPFKRTAPDPPEDADGITYGFAIASARTGPKE